MCVTPPNYLSPHLCTASCHLLTRVSWRRRDITRMRREMKASRKSIMSSAHENPFLFIKQPPVCCGSFHQRELTWAREDLLVRNWALVIQWVKGIKYLLGIREANTICVRARIWALALSNSLACRRTYLGLHLPCCARNIFLQSTRQNWSYPVTHFSRSHITQFFSGIPGNWPLETGV